MQFSILGPLSMTSGGKSFTPSAPKQRQLLSLLLVSANQLVSVESCVEELWEDRPPNTARATLHTYIRHLRRAVSQPHREGQAEGGAADGKEILKTRDLGYQLIVQPGQLDLHAFERQVKRALLALTKGDDATGAALLGEALATWRGPVLAEVHTGPILQAYVASLAEYRLSLLEQRIEADLRLGRHHQLIWELTELTAQHPTHESLHAQLMLALYRSGRSAQALEVFHRLRRVLASELGIEPTPRMHRFHRAVLASDPALEPPVTTAYPLTLDLVLRAG